MVQTRIAQEGMELQRDIVKKRSSWSNLWWLFHVWTICPIIVDSSAFFVIKRATEIPRSLKSSEATWPEEKRGMAERKAAEDRHCHLERFSKDKWNWMEFLSLENQTQSKLWFLILVFRFSGLCSWSYCITNGFLYIQYFLDLVISVWLWNFRV